MCSFLAPNLSSWRRYAPVGLEAGGHDEERLHYEEHRQEAVEDGAHPTGEEYGESSLQKKRRQNECCSLASAFSSIYQNRETRKVLSVASQYHAIHGWGAQRGWMCLYSGVGGILASSALHKSEASSFSPDL